MQAKVPIVPIIIRNAHDAMPKGSSVFRQVAIEVKVLPPVPTSRWRKTSLEKNIEKIRKEFLKELGQLPKAKLNGARANGKKVSKNGKVGK